MMPVGFYPNFFLSGKKRISNIHPTTALLVALQELIFQNPLPPDPHHSSTLTCQGLQELVTAALAPDQQVVGGFWVLKLHSQALVAESHFQMGNIIQVVRVILLQPVCRLSPNHRAQPSAAAGCPISSPT